MEDALRLWREKISINKAQTELNLTTDTKDNENLFHKNISNKSKAKEIPLPLLDAEGNIATKNEEKTELLNVFFPFSALVNLPLATEKWRRLFY